jgi:hypothetical protein
LVVQFIVGARYVRSFIRGARREAIGCEVGRQEVSISQLTDEDLGERWSFTKAMDAPPKKMVYVGK